MSNKLSKDAFIGILEQYTDNLAIHTANEHKMNSSLMALILQTEEYKKKLIKCGKDNDSFIESLGSEWLDLCFVSPNSNENFNRIDFTNLNTGIICEYLKTICSDEQVATNTLTEYISSNLKSLGNLCAIDPGRDSIQEAAYYEVIARVFQYFNVKSCYHKTILNCIAPISQYPTSICMLHDGGRLIVHLREVCMRWITLSEMNAIIRSEYGISSIDWRSLMSYKHYAVPSSAKNIKIITKSFYKAISIYKMYLRDAPSTRADIPCCFWVYPDIVDQLLMGCCSDYERHAAVSQIDFSNKDSIVSVIETEGTSLTLLIEDEFFESCDNSNDQNYRKRFKSFKKLLSRLYKDKSSIISKQVIARLAQQIFSLVCPSYSIHASRTSVLLMFGKKNLVTAVYKPEEMKGTSAQVAIVGDTIILQVFSIWWIVPDETISEILFKHNPAKADVSPIAIVDAVFRLSIHVSDLLTYSCQFFPTVQVTLRPLPHTNVIKKVVSRVKLAKTKSSIELATWGFRNAIQSNNSAVAVDDSFQYSEEQEGFGIDD